MSKSIKELRDTIHRKSSLLESFKNSFAKMMLENKKLKDQVSDITRLKDLLRTRDAKIISLETQIVMDKRKSHIASSLNNSRVRKSFKIPFMKESNHALFEVEKEVVGVSTNFSSRFMPNVKFKTAGYEDILAEIGIYTGGIKLYTNANGYIESTVFKPSLYKEVSIYEAIPELVPKDMVYNPHSDSLV